MTRWILLAAAACGHAGVDAKSAVAPAADPGQPARDAEIAARDAEIAARAAPFVDAFSNSGAVLAPGGQVVFVSTRDGLPQLYVGAIGEPDRLPAPPERVVAPRLLPDGKTLVFLSDVGSDRKFHVFRIGLDGSGLADLTPTGELRRMAPQVARRSGTMSTARTCSTTRRRGCSCRRSTARRARSIAIPGSGSSPTCRTTGRQIR